MKVLDIALKDLTRATRNRFAFGITIIAPLLLIGLMLVSGLESYILPFFIGYSLFILVFIALRRIINLNS